jgi:hypothetical protein
MILVFILSMGMPASVRQIVILHMEAPEYWSLGSLTWHIDKDW